MSAQCRCLDDGEVLDQRDCPVHGCECPDDQWFHDIDCPASVMRHFPPAPSLPVAADPKETP